MMNIYSRKDIGDWLDDKKIKEGRLSKYNLIYLREFKDLIKEYKILSVVLYTGMYRMGMKQFSQLFHSTQKLQSYCRRVIFDLKRKPVTKEYASVFDYGINRQKKRIEHMWKITKENYRYTEYYPFFESVGWDILTDFKMGDGNHNKLDREEFEAQFDCITDKFNQYKEENQTIIDEHMKSVEAEISAYNQHKMAVAEREKAEKEAARLCVREEREMEKEIKRNKAEHAKRERKINRSFEKYYR